MKGFLLAFLVFKTAECFYVPGVAPQTFHKGDDIEVRAIKMTSSHTQLPYEYYTLPFCKPKSGKVEYKSLNLGEILRGDRITNTGYELKMNEQVKCRVLCTGKEGKPIAWDAEESSRLHYFISQEYFTHFIVDNLPCATQFERHDTGKTEFEPGFRLGFEKGEETYVNNHLKFVMSYHEDPSDEGGFRVVGFRVEPFSVAKKDYEFTGDSCSINQKHDPQMVVDNTENKFYFTYEVQWVKSEIRWASRWDIYLEMADVHIHWFSIINSVVVVFFLSSIITMIIIRTLRKDIARYNADDDIEDSIEETGWKLVHGDVFRPPQNARLFVAVIGSGVQICCMIGITIFFAMLGMLSPASRGALLTAAIFLYEFMGLVAGYFAGRLYRTLKGKDWKRAALLTSTLYPGIIFGLGFFVNFFIWDQRSSGAIPFTTMLSMMAMWFGIAFPLVYLGYFFGFRKQPYDQPVRTNQIPRQIPTQMWYMHLVPCTLATGLLPFSACFIELFFIFSAVYENKFFYLFGFLFLVFIILIISSSQISIVMIYLQLCAGNYHWWWRSFLVSGGSAVYVFAYSVFYFITKMEIDEFVPSLVYFSYTIMMVLTFGLLTGTIGFYASFLFIRKIYASVKID